MRYYSVLICIVLCAAGYAVYSYIFPTLDVRFRLTMEVTAGGKLYTTSSVVDATLEKASYFRVAGGPLLVFMNGPCPSVDLGPFGTLFIVDAVPRLVRSKSDIGNGKFLYPHATWLALLPFEVFDVKPRGLDYPLRVLDHEHVSGTLEGEVDVPLDRLPMIVRFRNIDEPNSLEELDPSDLSAAYGPGSRVIRATLKMTKERVASIPSYWPAWIAAAPSPMSALNVAVPYKGTNGSIETANDFLDISGIRGYR